MTVGDNRICIVAEAGVNHCGSLSRALEMVDVAARAGADYVKFQSFVCDELVTASAPKAAYQRESTGSGSQREMLAALELDRSDHEALVDRCRESGIGFLSTPFDEQSVSLLVELGVERLKISSGDLTNGPLLLAVARTGLPVILSTGMATLDEVGAALAVLAYGYTGGDAATPGPGDFSRAFSSREGRASLEGRVTLLQCTSEYPAPGESVNLRAMDTLRAEFGLPVGFSDHTIGIAATAAAAARGAVLVEKHFTLDRSLPGPDHASSLEPDALEAMVRGIRDVETLLGDGRKRPGPVERENAAVARRSLVAATDIAEGEPFTGANLAVRRAGAGRSPMEYWSLLGQPAPRSFSRGELV